ncbi:MAG: hypothetical protein SNJ77_12060 [Cytophagales bacterium]
MGLNNIKRLEITKRGEGGSGGDDKFTSDFVVSLTGGKTFGKYWQTLLHYHK